MSRRKISHQQRFRILKLQEQRLKRAQKHLQIQPEEDANLLLGPEEEGLLITQHGVFVDVEDQNGQIYRCRVRQHLGSVVAGDRLIFQKSKGYSGIVVAVCPRESILQRIDERQQPKLIAANVDQVIIVIACEPEPSLLLLDRYLIACHYLAISPLILLNKIDILDHEKRERFQQILTLYGNIGYKVCTSSIKLRDGLKQLEIFLKNKCSVFVGQSGVGKSSLINKLIPKANMATQDLSAHSNLGMHTTTRSHLFHLSGNARIIDSPGIRDFALIKIPAYELSLRFPEFIPFVEQCKFRNCSHQHEPECAVKKAVEEGKISPLRLQSYYSLLETL